MSATRNVPDGHIAGRADDVAFEAQGQFATEE